MSVEATPLLNSTDTGLIQAKEDSNSAASVIHLRQWNLKAKGLE